MKFPLSHAPFGDYPALTEAQAEQINEVVQQSLTETLAEYESHQQKQRRLLPRSQYKVVKKVENLICYRQRSGVSSEAVLPVPDHSSSQLATPSSVLSASASYSSAVQTGDNDSIWRTPKLVTVGTMVGALDDVMYGLLATDATSTFIRASYTNEELLDSELLHCIKSPTPESPFQFCGVKWHVLELSKISSKRDFVFVEASGVIVRPNGDRVGYHIMHSVDLPGLAELSEQYQVLRARVVSCHLFRQLPNNTVDVYMKGIVDPSGHMPGTFAIATTVNALLKLGQAVECAHSKKLEYLLEQKQLKRAGATSRTSGVSGRSSGHSDRSYGSIKSTKSSGSSKPCAVCATTLHLFRSVAHCELCSQAVCSRCRVTRRLSYRVARPKELKQQNTIFCTTCVSTAINYSSAAVARAELTAPSSVKKTPRGLNTLVSNQLRHFLSSSTLSSNNTVLSSSNYSRLETPVEEEEEDLSSRRRSLSTDGTNVQVRRRSLTHPPESNDKVEKLTELDLSVSLSVVSSCSDYLDEDFYDNEAGRRKTQPPSAFTDLPECEPMNPLASSMPPKPTASSINSPLRSQRELMRRMEELRQNAESVYQFTRRNTQSMQCGGVALQSQSVCLTTTDIGLD